MDKLSQMVLMGAARKKGFDPNTPIGTFVEGGFFTGIINEGGQKYAIIVAPRASGQSFLEYKTVNSGSPAATRTLNNGPAATAAMVSAGNHPAAAFCAALSINGFSDWYLPARDELELCYRNLKPTTQTNNIQNRPLSAFTYPEGNDLSNDTAGRNRNSNPARGGYAGGNPAINPAQTSVIVFRAGGTEAFTSEVLTTAYFSSSEFAAISAWRQRFDNGLQNSNNKNTAFRVRAVRRVAV